MDRARPCTSLARAARRTVATAAALGLAATLVPGAGAPEAAAAGCWALPDAAVARPTGLRPSDGTFVNAYQSRAATGWTRILVAEGDLRRSRLAVMTRPTLGTVAPTSDLLARTSPHAVVGVNSDYFEMETETRALTEGPQVRGGSVLYARPGEHRFVGVDRWGRPATGFLRVGGRVVSADPDGAGPRTATALPLTAVNAAPANGSVAVWTPALSGAVARPRSGHEVLVVDGRIVAGGSRVSVDLAHADPRRVLVVSAAGAAARALAALPAGRSLAWNATALDRSGQQMWDASGSGRPIVEGGRTTVSCAEEMRRPRTVLAWNARRDHVWLITASGTNGYDDVTMYVGVSHHQIAEVARRLGATEAVALDGGGSTTMVVRVPRRGLVRMDSVPFRRVTERRVAVGWALVQTS